ncbi:MAG: DUF1800 family protein [Burkholderiales bacterium]|nr:DUF1800 family protein [Burkholderiales bacterium]
MRHLVLTGRRERLRRWILGTALCVSAGLSGSPFAHCSLDIDANGAIDARTDGVLILRAGFGLSGAALVQGALGTGATRTDPVAILAYIDANKTTQYDLDGNGSFDALTDGMLILRYMFGLSGSSVMTGAVGANPSRPDWTAVNSFLLNGCGTGPSAQLRDASRLLTQATWGPKHAEILALAASPPPQADNWITQQFALPGANHIDWIIARDAIASVSTTDSFESFWMQALGGNDQLRQRVAYALSQILVVSDQKDGLGNPWLISGYFDVLSRNAFGNFRTLLEDITKNPAMALWLDHMCNDKETTTRLPNENYAREILQLFSIGTVWLNQDGTPMTDAQNNPLPTYDQNVVQGFAKVFTGWSYSGSANWCAYPQTDLPWYAPLVAFNSRHSISSKQLLSLTPDGASVVLPAQTAQTANAQADLTAALDNIFNHPNVGPYIGKQLIKLLVTSNPGPGFVSRVAAAFADNGGGVRGDMQAVIRAVLTDVDARDPDIALDVAFGKLREPAVRFGNLMRTFHATAASGRYSFWTLGDPLYGVNQQPLSSPTVFNFYSPDFSPQGAVGANGLTGPEFEITTSTAIVTTSNNMAGAITGGWGSGADKMVLDYAALAPLAGSPDQIVDYLWLVMGNGVMTPTTYAQMVSAVGLIPQTGLNWQADRWKLAIWILFNSPEYVIQR